MGTPTVTQTGVLDMQVCVPSDWKDQQVVKFANLQNPCGTISGWSIVRKGSKWLAGDPERKTCDDDSDMVHIMLGV